MNFKPLLFVIFFLVGLQGAAGVQPSFASQHCVSENLVVLGDSLVAGYGLRPGEAFPEQLAQELSKKGYETNVINAGVSGDTSSGGLARLEWSVPENTDAVIVELGANDALRGIQPSVTRKNLSSIIEKLKERGANVLLAGMLAPPNMGEDYASEFNAIYPELAKAHDVLLYPFFLDGVAAETDLNQDDGIHPTAEGIRIIVEKFLPYGEKLIKLNCDS